MSMKRRLTLQFMDFGDGDGIDIEHTHDNLISATEYIEAYRTFLLGLGFHDKSILSALRMVIEEHYNDGKSVEY